MQTKIIPGYTNYTISEDGAVTSLKTGKLLSQKINSDGYYQVSLLKDGNTNRTLNRIHRLLMITFKPVENMDKLVIDHLDCDKTNNSLDNLEWVTSKENTHRAIKNGCYKNGRQVISDETVLAIRKEYIPGKNGNFRELLEKYNLKKSMFYYIINGNFRKDLTSTEELNNEVTKIKKNHSLTNEQIDELKEILTARRNGTIKISKIELGKKFGISNTSISNYEKRLFPSD